jgi:hypothetical protein
MKRYRRKTNNAQIRNDNDNDDDRPKRETPVLFPYWKSKQKEHSSIEGSRSQVPLSSCPILGANCETFYSIRTQIPGLERPAADYIYIRQFSGSTEVVKHSVGSLQRSIIANRNRSK